MTIKEFAKEKGITTQAVYQRIKAAGLDFKALKKENSPELTKDGITILNGLFDKNRVQNESKTSEIKAKITALQLEVEKLKEENERLRNDRDAWKEQAESWKASATAAQEISSRIQAALEQAQEIAQREQALHLTALKTASQRRLTLKERITGRLQKGPENE